jgi:tetratricopeptide (TPR) repeat protein
LSRLPVVWAEAMTSFVAPRAALRTSMFDHYRELDTGRLALSWAIVTLAIAVAALALHRRMVLPAWAVAAVLLSLAPIAVLTTAAGWTGWGRYLYPSAPLVSLAIAGAAAEVGRRWLHAAAARRAAFVGAGLVLIALSAQTFAAGLDYRDERSFALAQIRDNPQSWYGFYQLGTLALSHDDLDEAIPNLSRAAELAPGDIDIWRRLALALASRRQFPASAQAARSALALEPGDRYARLLLGRALIAQGQPAEGVEHVLDVIVSTPDPRPIVAELHRALVEAGPDSALSRALRDRIAAPRYQRIEATVRSWLEPAPR